MPRRRREPFHRQADVRRAPVEPALVVDAVADRAELGRDDDLVAPAGDGAGEQLLVQVGSVDLGRVQEGDAEFERAVDRADRALIVLRGSGVERAHAHEAESDAPDDGSVRAEGDLLHACATFSS